ncbi:MAG: C39 family peptidase [Candidatus Sericytochromatia bacterium]
MAVEFNSLRSEIKQFISDGKISKDEYKLLNSQISRLDIPQKDKDAFMDVLHKIKKYTNESSFLFFKLSDGVLSQKEFENVAKLAQKFPDNPLVQDLFNGLKESFMPPSTNDSMNMNTNYSNNNPQPYDLGLDNSSQMPSTEFQNQSIPEQNYQQLQNYEIPYKQPEVDPNSNFFTKLFGHKEPEAVVNTPIIDNSIIPENQSISKPENLSCNFDMNDYFVCQGTNLPSRSGDCGPSSASMILKAFGVCDASDETMIKTVRAAAGVTKKRGGAWALDESEVTKAIEKISKGKVEEKSNKSFSTSNQKTMINHIKAELKAGRLPIIETGSPYSQNRHYMVVSNVKPDGTLVVADPGTRAMVNEFSPSELTALMKKADKRGGTHILSYGQA